MCVITIITNNKWKMQSLKIFKLVFIRYNFLITTRNQIIDQPGYYVLCINVKYIYCVFINV